MMSFSFDLRSRVYPHHPCAFDKQLPGIYPSQSITGSWLGINPLLVYTRMWPCENLARAGTKQSMVSFHTSKKREMRPVTKALIRDIVFTKGKIKIK